jgi:peptidoglycan/LPS O-acetylase OafA/YrhL
VKGREYIVSLTGLRGIAALLVFLYHYSALHPGIRLDLTVPWIGSVLQFPLGLGGVGVDVFFVLSGFLLGLPFARAALGAADAPVLSRYFRRRFLRVFPAYYAQLGVIMAAGAWFVTWRPQTVETFLAHLVMFFNIGWEPVTPIVGVWWTLPVEMGFYLLLPLLAPLMRPSRWLPTLVLGLAASVAYRAWAGAHFGAAAPGAAFLAAVQLPGSLPEFLLGASAALLVQQRAIMQQAAPAPWLLDALLVLGLLLPALWMWHVVVGAGTDFWLGHWSMLVSPIALGLPLAAAVTSLYWGSRLGRLLLANRGVYFFGLISYSLYLWHFPVMQQLQKLAGPGYADWPHWIKFPLCVVAVTAVAGLSYYLVERPFYRLKTWRQLFGGQGRAVA